MRANAASIPLKGVTMSSRSASWEEETTCALFTDYNRMFRKSPLLEAYEACTSRESSTGLPSGSHENRLRLLRLPRANHHYCQQDDYGKQTSKLPSRIRFAGGATGENSSVYLRRPTNW